MSGVVEKIKQIFSCEARSHVVPWTTDSIRILKQIEKNVLEELGKVAQKIDVNGKAFMEVLEQEIEYFRSSGEFDDLEAYQKKLREIMGYVEHFIEEQKGLLVEPSKEKRKDEV